MSNQCKQDKSLDTIGGPKRDRGPARQATYILF